MPTSLKSLATLRDEWSDCSKCNLGIARKGRSADVVWGQGTARNGIMFIAGGPRDVDEQANTPFYGEELEFFHEMLEKADITDYYLTHLVVCRSFDYAHDNEGNPRTDRYGNPQVYDKEPLPQYVNECLPRLYEEIYLVDPKVIVTIGKLATETLTKKPISIMKDHGVVRTIEIPGAAFVPSITEKRRHWVRKYRGDLIAPVVRNTVKYLLVPTVSFHEVRKHGPDGRPGNHFDGFFDDIKNASAVYKRLMASADERAK